MLPTRGLARPIVGSEDREIVIDSPDGYVLTWSDAERNWIATPPAPIIITLIALAEPQAFP